MDNENINIEVSEPFPSQIDYSLTMEELDKYVDEQMELINSGHEKAANIELMMLAYSFDFIYWAKAKCNVEFRQILNHPYR